MIIRRATSKDISEILQLFQIFVEEHDQMVLSKNQRFKPLIKLKEDYLTAMRKFFNKQRLSREGLVLVASDKEKAVGFCVSFIRRGSMIYTLNKKTLISDLFLLKEYRGKKISSLFFKMVKKWSKERGVKYIGINVYSDNPHAHKVYQKWGFWDHHVEMMLRLP